MGQRLRVPRWKERNTLHVSCDQIYIISSHNVFNFLYDTNIFSNNIYSQPRLYPYSLEYGYMIDDLISNDQSLKLHRKNRTNDRTSQHVPSNIIISN